MPQLRPTDKDLDLEPILVHEDRNEEGESFIEVIVHPQVGVADLEEEVVPGRGPVEDHQVAPLDLQDPCGKQR